MLKLIVWSDFDCPYCYISKHQLAKLLEAEGITDYDLEMWPYQLMPEKENEPHKTFLEAQDYTNEADYENACKLFKKIEELGRENGLELHLDRMRSVNTKDAHRLALWAHGVDYKKAALLIEEICRGQFCLGEDISDFEQLLKYVKKAGLSETEALTILESDQFAKEIDEFEDKSIDEDIELIPHYYFPNNYQISGIPPISHLQNILKKSLEPKS